MNLAADSGQRQIKIKFSPKEIGLNALFEKKTGIIARMILDFDQHVFFFVDPEHFQRTIGENFGNLRFFNNIFHKRIHIIKFSPNPVMLMKYCLPSIQICDPEVRISGNKREITIFLDPALKPIVKGNNGQYLHLLNEIFARLFNIKKISIEIV